MYLIGNISLKGGGGITASTSTQHHRIGKLRDVIRYCFIAVTSVTLFGNVIIYIVYLNTIFSVLYMMGVRFLVTVNAFRNAGITSMNEIQHGHHAVRWPNLEKKLFFGNKRLWSIRVQNNTYDLLVWGGCCLRFFFGVGHGLLDGKKVLKCPVGRWTVFSFPFVLTGLRWPPPCCLKMNEFCNLIG